MEVPKKNADRFQNKSIFRIKFWGLLYLGVRIQDEKVDTVETIEANQEVKIDPLQILQLKALRSNDYDKFEHVELNKDGQYYLIM